jgi:hypothetical protein
MALTYLQGGNRRRTRATQIAVSTALGLTGPNVQAALDAIQVGGAGRAELALLNLAATPISSANTTNLATATGDYVSVTGTTTIAALGTAAAGTRRLVRFAAALILTHNATSLILPGATNITTVAGDIAEFISLGSGNWFCNAYQRNDGGGISAALPISRGGTSNNTAYGGKDNLSVKGADIASAATTNLATATGDVVDVTGTTTITALGTAAAGVQRCVRFTGGLVLTHNGTSLILPGSANITTIAGDVARFVSLGSGNWYCANYHRGDGAGIGSGSPLVVARGGTGVGSVPLLRALLNTIAPTGLTDAASITTDCALDDRFTVTLGGNRTLANPTNVVAGAWYTWVVTQDGTGSRTLALGANFVQAPGDSFLASTAAGAIDILTGYAISATKIALSYRRGYT